MLWLPFIFTVDRINMMLAANGMPRCETFTRHIPGISREAQACGALERKLRMDGLEVEHLRFHMKDGQRVRMLLGERVNALEARLTTVTVGDVSLPKSEIDDALDAAGITVNVHRVETTKGEFLDMPYFGEKR